MIKERFIEYIQYNKRYSPHTVAAYRKDIEQFTEFLKTKFGKDNLAEADYKMIRLWLADMMEQKITARSVNRKISTLKSLYKYLLKEEVINENPLSRVLSPKTPKKLPVFVEKENMQLLFDENMFPEGFRGARDRLIIEMFYATGMRVSELVNLEEMDVDIYNNTLKVLGKRNKERIIPFGKNLRQLIICYKEEREKILNDSENKYIFITEKGEKVYRKLLWKLVNHYLNFVTTINKKSPHVLRHTFATHMLNNGADLNAIKELLGHANLSATQIYTHNSIDKLKTIYKQAHPRA